MTDPTNSPKPIEVIAEEKGLTPEKADLGQRMGRDAQRVARGELSEDEFYKMYHDEVVEQFGFDDRPVGEDS
jgi:hypothetical protein